MREAGLRRGGLERGSGGRLVTERPAHVARKVPGFDGKENVALETGSCRAPNQARRPPQTTRSSARKTASANRAARELISHVIAQGLAARGMPELANGLGFDLAHALAGHAEHAADFLERAGIARVDAEPKLDDLGLAVR